MSVLILTSTVNVNSFMTVVVDPKIRLQQYLDSIHFYLDSKNIKKIIVCDNSGFDYSLITTLVEHAVKKNKIIEFLYFKGTLDKIQEFGKGFGEGEIMSFVFKNSKLINQEENTFLKVTGRLKIINIDSVVKSLKSNLTYFQPVNLNPFVNLKKVDTRFYQCTKLLFEELLKDSYFDVHDKENVFLEHVYYKKLVDNRIKFKNFIILPNFLGISGSTGIVYEMSRSELIVRQILFNLFKILKKR
jgi:hypothetical protein